MKLTDKIKKPFRAPSLFECGASIGRGQGKWSELDGGLAQVRYEARRPEGYSRAGGSIARVGKFAGARKW